ncbi:Uncharacterised protein [Bordetella ansorpii]|uniref:Uncharacterized protein n=1 Tax=Bordetella ansorpii TaxID=288768 RepID=A0A157SU46_9BORD|nr:hypothetical protein [Bordetella ansorpii]SAI73875.1 Uncharacterised protein [Bordetella ansorpii]
MTLNAALLAALCAFYVAMMLRHGRQNALTPRSFYAAINLMRLGPYMVAVLVDPGMMDSRIYHTIGAVELEGVIRTYLACELLGAVLFFYLLRGARLEWCPAAPASARPARPPGLWAIVLLVAVALVLVVIRVQAAGGLGFLLANLALRAEITAGYGFLVTPAYACFAIATVAALQRVCARRCLFDWAVFIGVITIGALGMSAFGGRKDALLLACTALIAYASLVRPLRWTSPVFPTVFVCVAAYSYFLGAARQLGGLDMVSADPLAVAGDGLRNLSTFFKTLSYVDTYLFIVSYFQHADYWWFSIFQNLPASFMPSLLYPDKPPVDEGVYIRSLLEGYALTPPIPARDLYPSSLPPETLGNGYAAFGMAGVAAFFALKAWCFRLAFSLRLGAWKALPMVFLVCFAYNFQVSPLRLVQILQVLAVCLALNVLIRFFRKSST